MPYNWKCCSFYPNNFGASALKRKIPFYIRFVSSILERLDFCAVLGTNTGGLHITLAIPNSFFRGNINV